MKFAFLVLILIAGGQVFGEISVTSETLAQGKLVYLTNCTSCHGEKGDGKGPAAVAIKAPKPRNFVSDKFKYGQKPREIFKTITHGVPNTAMPAWNALSEKDRWSVVHYIKSLKKN